MTNKDTKVIESLEYYTTHAYPNEKYAVVSIDILRQALELIRELRGENDNRRKTTDS